MTPLGVWLRVGTCSQSLALAVMVVDPTKKCGSAWQIAQERAQE